MRWRPVKWWGWFFVPLLWPLFAVLWVLHWLVDAACLAWGDE